MQYDMFKTIDVEKQKEGFNRHQTQSMATVIQICQLNYTILYFRQYCVKFKDDLTPHSKLS